jgi:hypothetical protein
LNILDKAFRILPKSVQSGLLIEDLKRVEGFLEYHKGTAKYLEERKEDLRYKLHKLGADGF